MDQRNDLLLGLGIIFGIAIIGSLGTVVGHVSDMVARFVQFVCFPVVGLAAMGAVYFIVTGFADWRQERNIRGREFQLEEMERLGQLQINQKRSDLVYPDYNGSMPLALQDVIAGTVREQLLVLQSQLIESQRTWQDVPHTIHYKPALTNNGPELLEARPQPFQAPSFHELFASGQLPANGFLLGFREDGSQIVKGWTDLYSCIVNGASGTGKSTLLRLILAQAANQGAKFLIADPHYGAGPESLGASLNSLYSRMAGGVATNDKEILEMAQYVSSVGVNRLAGKDTDRTPLIMVMDETTSLLSRSSIATELENVLGHITQETRKVGVYGICLGQNFNSDIMPTRIRNCFASVLSTPATRETLGRFLTKKAAQALEELQFTQALWSKVGAEYETFTFPNCTAHDIELVAGKDGSYSRSDDVLTTFSDDDSDVLSQVQNVLSDNSERTENAPRTRPEWTPLELRVADMLKQKATNTDIYNALLKGGMSKQDSWNFIAEVIAKGMQ